MRFIWLLFAVMFGNAFILVAESPTAIDLSNGDYDYEDSFETSVEASDEYPMGNYFDVYAGIEVHNPLYSHNFDHTRTD